jgi:hypothetical protein
LHSGIEIVFLKMIEVLVVIVVSRQQAIHADQLQCRQISALLSRQSKFFRAHVRLRLTQAGIILHGHGYQVGAFLLRRPRQVFRRDFYGLLLRQSQLAAQVNFQFIFAPLQLQNALHHLCFSELRPRYFYR